VSQLPDRPSLSHLRKQAKDLLHNLRRQNSEATLAEAQHLLARQYGFASWPKMRAHVELLAVGPQSPTFQRYTLKAREAVFFSRCEADQQGSPSLEPEHVLLGLIRASQGLKGFDGIASSLDHARSQLTSKPPASDPLQLNTRMSAGERAKNIFRTAAKEADALKHHDIGLAHVLLGVLHESDSRAATSLDRSGIRLQLIRDGMGMLLNEEPL